MTLWIRIQDIWSCRHPTAIFRASFLSWTVRSLEYCDFTSRKHLSWTLLHFCLDLQFYFCFYHPLLIFIYSHTCGILCAMLGVPCAVPLMMYELKCLVSLSFISLPRRFPGRHHKPSNDVPDHLGLPADEERTFISHRIWLDTKPDWRKFTLPECCSQRLHSDTMLLVPICQRQGWTTIMS